VGRRSGGRSPGKVSRNGIRRRSTEIYGFAGMFPVQAMVGHASVAYRADALVKPHLQSSNVVVIGNTTRLIVTNLRSCLVCRFDWWAFNAERTSL
jgi:hypothetical protein